MQTPKARTSSSGVHQRKSPQSISSEASQRTSPKAASSEVSQKDSPRVVRQLKISPRYLNPTASSTNQATKGPKESSPKVSNHRSPNSPLPKKIHPGRVAELELQISQLEHDLKVVKDHLCTSETYKKQALEDAKESNQHLLAVSSELEEIQKQITEHSASQKVCVLEPCETADEQDRNLKSEVEALREKHSQDLDVLASALEEIEQLKFQIGIASDPKPAHAKQAESAQTELGKLKENLAETLWVVEDMMKQVKDCKESEDRAREIVGETLMQLEMAKKTVEILRADGNKATEIYGALTSELEKSRAHASILEELVSNLKAEINCAGYKDFQKKDICENKIGNERAEEAVEAELNLVRLEVEQLRSALETTEMRYNKEQDRYAEENRTAVEMLEQIKSASGLREAELEAELRKSKYEIEELKTNLVDKESELQGICEENDDLLIRLENAVSQQREHELEKELQELKGEMETMKARLTEKDTEWQNIIEENQTLKLEIEELSQTSNDAASNLDMARAAEREALMKVGYITEEADKSNRKLGRVTEQLEAEQAAYAELEVELRKLKVQSDQWRKAAETATSMLSAGNNNGHLIERTGSMDSSYCPRTRRIISPYADELDEELFKKRNANLLRRFGVFWKMPLK